MVYTNKKKPANNEKKETEVETIENLEHQSGHSLSQKNHLDILFHNECFLFVLTSFVPMICFIESVWMNKLAIYNCEAPVTLSDPSILMKLIVALLWAPLRLHPTWCSATITLQQILTAPSRSYYCNGVPLSASHPRRHEYSRR